MPERGFGRTVIRFREINDGAFNFTAELYLIHGSMTDAGPEFTAFDCAILIETIEHIDPGRLSALEHAVFRKMQPATVVVTTPNAEFNPHRFRHSDHRFEWDRTKFQRWARGVAARNGYDVVRHDIGGAHPTLGGASQMAVFKIEISLRDFRAA
jgi:small RNA 2'-O-methyltransferase